MAPGTNSLDSSARSGKKVTFGHLKVREYCGTALDDSPAVTSGAAIAMGGYFVDHGPVPIEFFEMRRGRRKQKEELKLSDEERLHRLLASGYRKEQIHRAIVDSRRAKLRRQRAVHNLNNSSEEVVEAFVAKFKDFVTPRKAGGKQEGEKPQAC